jgi:GT2 family glycosyltransferase
MSNPPIVTILVPNYRTLVLTQLCLRLIRYWTDPKLYRVIVIDNDSQDDSLAYLKTVSWIDLIERKAIPGEGAPLSHSRALDQALALVDTPYVLSIHTDTLVKQAAWLPFLLQDRRRRFVEIRAKALVQATVEAIRVYLAIQPP